MMTTVRLETARGDFVTYASVPPFVSMPTVLTWGIRTFVYHGRTFVLRDFAFVPRYRESFAAAIVDGATPRDTPEAVGAKPEISVSIKLEGADKLRAAMRDGAARVAAAADAAVHQAAEKIARGDGVGAELTPTGEVGREVIAETNGEDRARKHGGHGS